MSLMSDGSALQARGPYHTAASASFTGPTSLNSDLMIYILYLIAPFYFTFILIFITAYKHGTTVAPVFFILLSNIR